MQLLKITTTPIKYRIESERASMTLADPDSTKSFQQVKESVTQNTKKESNSAQDLKIQSDTISLNNKSKVRTDGSINSSSVKLSANNDYIIQYRYGHNKKPEQSCINIQNSIPVHKNASIQEKLKQIKSLKPDPSWEPSHSEDSSSFKTYKGTEIKDNPEYEFTPATWRLIVEELADVKIEYLGGFIYVPKSSAPDYEGTENITKE